ncbi:hypothetical protein AVEN_117796-1 [Araneus ventricosus]|uniref:Uncharacterized protein n=1 Tax=Araneus ventricosus TaxID=182803 RepID=A0A4Y2B7A3_ARAVE|nr:hypothetical protein AVEN_117796-1 [Araneus ventricosus]
MRNIKSAPNLLQLEVSWNWTTYHKSPFALPVLQNLMSNVLWKTFDDKLGRELKIILQPITIIGQKSIFLASETAFTAMLISLFLMLAAIAFGLEVVKEKEVCISCSIFRRIVS